jgi:excisionase family DNA binding protein
MTQRTRRDRITLTVPNPTPTELLDVTDAAAHLGTPVRFIRRLIAERRIRFYKVGRYVRIDRHDLDTFIAAGCIEPSTDARHAPSTGWRLQ